MSKKKDRKRRDALAPACYKDKFFFRSHESVCKTCPYYYPCGTEKHGPDLVGMLGTNRGKIEIHMVRNRVPAKDAIVAITKLFDVSRNAASLSFSRRKKKVK